MQQFEICRLIWHCGATWIWPCTCRTSGTHVLFSRHVRGIAAGIPTHSGWRRTPGTAGTGICEQASGQVGYAGNGLTAFSDHRRLCPVGLFCGQHKQINIRSYMSIIGIVALFCTFLISRACVSETCAVQPCGLVLQSVPRPADFLWQIARSSACEREKKHE